MDHFLKQRQALVEHLQRAGIQNPSVLAAILKTPRHIFVPMAWQTHAYEDNALPLSEGQTISQPYIVAKMTEACLQSQKTLHSVLEIGTGSGYQAAVLAQLSESVYSIERIQNLLTMAQQHFTDLGYTHIHTSHGDGYQGWEEHSPYDAILVTAAVTEIPKPLLKQLRVGGCLVVPKNDTRTWDGQTLLRIIRDRADHYQTETLDAVRFVPLLRGKI